MRYIIDTEGIRCAARRGDQAGVDRRLEELPEAVVRVALNGDPGNFVGEPYANREVPVIGAARFGHVALIEYLVRLGARLDRFDADGMGVVHAAAAGGYASCVERLIRLGAPVNTLTKSGASPLHLSVKSSRDGRLVSALLQARVKPNIRIQPEGYTALDMAIEKGAGQLARILLPVSDAPLFERPKGRTILHPAASSNSSELLQLILDQNFPDTNSWLDRPDDAGFTPFLTAIKSGRVENARLLQERGANLLARDALGNTALHHATNASSLACVQLVLSAPLLNPMARNTEGDAATVNAHSSDAVAIMELLVAHGYDINHHDARLTTPLMRATAAAHSELIDLYLRFNADLNAQTQDRQSALSIAVTHGSLETTELLLRCGATVAGSPALRRVRHESMRTLLNDERWNSLQCMCLRAMRTHRDPHSIRLLHEYGLEKVTGELLGSSGDALHIRVVPLAQRFER